jgi:hypothetical protein
MINGIMFHNIQYHFVFEKIIGLSVFFCAIGHFKFLQASRVIFSKRASVQKAKADGYEEFLGYQVGNCVRWRSNRYPCSSAPEVG